LELHKANAILVDEKPGSMKAARDALHDVGFRRFHEMANLAEVQERLASVGCDVLICDAETGGGMATKMFHNIRQGDVGGDPFLPIIATTWDPKRELVSEVISSGADLLLTLPMTIGKMKTAIETLINKRKPFVVTSDYIGPDRRSNPREDDNPIPQVKVPNRLRHTATGDDDGVDHAAIQEVVQEQRVERYVNKILVTAGMITSIPEEHKNKLPRLLKELAEAAEMLDKRIADTRFNHQAELCKMLVAVGRRMMTGNTPKASDMELVRQLGNALQLVMKAEDQASIDAARKITELIIGNMAST
jgi:DNA-binding NarL/FixJ family response regulator